MQSNNLLYFPPKINLFFIICFLFLLMMMASHGIPQSDVILIDSYYFSLSGILKELNQNSF